MGSAIIRKPKVFLMDEPLSNLDAKLRTQMRIELAKLHKELETTIIYVTHDQKMCIRDRYNSAIERCVDVNGCLWLNF